MKLLTILAFSSLALAGVACSESKTAVHPETETIAMEQSSGGTLNLSLPDSVADSGSTGGTLNLNLGGSDDSGTRLIGDGQLGGPNFGTAPETPATIEFEAEPATEDDDIIRLTPN